MTPFTYSSDPIRIVFGAGALSALAAEADFHKMSRLLVLCSKNRADYARRLTASLGDRVIDICNASAPNMPRDAFDRIVAELKRIDADGFVVIGGGSPIGLGKAAAAATKLPYIAVVTTYSGSEMAARWYVGVADKRINGNDVACLPATAIYDPELTLDLPARTSAASGMNAVAHAVESLYVRACGLTRRQVLLDHPGRGGRRQLQPSRGDSDPRDVVVHAGLEEVLTGAIATIGDGIPGEGH